MPTTTTTRTREQELATLEAALSKAHLTLADARRILLPKDPWEAARGLWKGRKVDGMKEQRKLRKEWERGIAFVSAAEQHDIEKRYGKPGRSVVAKSIEIEV